MKRVERTRLARAKAAALLLALAAAGAAFGRAPQTGQLVVRVTDSGFAPAEATVQQGLVHLSLVNGGGSEAVKIKIAREGAGQLREVEVAGGGTALTELEAAAGAYTLTEAGHGWVFRLTVTAPPTPTPDEPPAE